jgi:hypothetical protein
MGNIFIIFNCTALSWDTWYLEPSMIQLRYTWASKMVTMPGWMPSAFPLMMFPPWCPATGPPTPPTIPLCMPMPVPPPVRLLATVSPNSRKPFPNVLAAWSTVAVYDCTPSPSVPPDDRRAGISLLSEYTNLKSSNRKLQTFFLSLWSWRWDCSLFCTTFSSSHFTSKLWKVWKASI